jgi:predicted lipid-binding transport protein (Tim44 family)
VPVDEQVRVWVSESFPAIQAAWSSGSADRLEPYMSARLSEHLSQQLAGLRRDGVVNRVEEPRLLEVHVLPRRSTDPVVEVAFAARDWLADLRSGAVLDGDPHRDALFRQHWHLLRGGPTGWLLDRVLPA